MTVDTYAIGTRVVFWSGAEGLITAICVRYAGQVLYEVTWWNGNERHESWISPAEIQCKDGYIVERIGY